MIADLTELDETLKLGGHALRTFLLRHEPVYLAFLVLSLLVLN